jgi:hypothetical protein
MSERTRAKVAGEKPLNVVTFDNVADMIRALGWDQPAPSPQRLAERRAWQRFAGQTDAERTADYHARLAMTDAEWAQARARAAAHT